MQYLIFLMMVVLAACNNWHEPESGLMSTRNDSFGIETSDTLIDMDNSDTAHIEDEKLYNPDYLPFYNGLTITKIVELYPRFQTASGPLNPLKIECHPEYKDSATGIYFFNDTNGFHCQVSVSIFQKWFYDNDTNQRINSLCVYHEDNKIKEYFPFRIGKKLPPNLEYSVSKNPSISIHNEKDYSFYLLTEQEVLLAFYAKRKYCKHEVLTMKELNKCEEIMLKNIKINLEHYEQ